MREDRGLLETWGADDVAQRFASASAQTVIAWALEQWGPRIAVCTSFQAEGMVILDMAWRIDPKVRVFTVDTGRLPQETYDIMERVRERYKIEVEVFFPDPRQVEAMVRGYGPNLFYKSVEARMWCCHVRKVEPMRRALDGLEAWITGLRRDQSTSRTLINKIELDAEHGGLMKLNPLCDWTSDQVWHYIATYNVPCHRLYQQGYTSIGCAPCTRPTQLGDDVRAGRWWWEQNAVKECGIHGHASAGRGAC
ncbi:MAG TPA: phosphoadenylyl-sulfate reductase [Candidatus Tectomicrobia bacterium]